MQGRTILVNCTPHEVRVAVLHGGNISELYIERPRKKSVVGNIYKGRVVKILPGMQSAFVDIGLSRAAFLHVADIHTLLENEVEQAAEEGEEEDVLESTGAAAPQNFPPIESILTEKQEILVQVAKDSTGGKGARLTTQLSIPGRHLVLIPTCPHTGISRKIEDAAQREKLKEILTAIRPAAGGLIARTMSQGQSIEELTYDRNYLVRIWEKVQADSSASGAPKLLYEEDNLVYRIIRDLVDASTREIIIDSPEEYDRLLELSATYIPDQKVKITLYTKDTPLFDLYNVEIEINRILDKKIWLRSGGYIVIDQAEAFTVIDVNTGRFVGKRNFEETILKTNLEAAKEIAHQLRLRNIGGIIIVDFIDMQSEENRQKVLELTDSLLKEDRARASVMNITSLGLVEITRKRTQESLIRLMGEPCPYCDGRGVIKSRITICYDILRQFRRMAAECRGGKIVLEAHNEIADILLSSERESLAGLEADYSLTIEVKPCPHFHLEHYKLIPAK